MSLRNIIGTIFLLSCIKAQAQNASNSPYSVYGIGIINDRTSSMNRSLGGTGIGIQDDYNLNTLNPASYLSIISPISHVFEFSIYGERNGYRTNTLSYTKTNGGLSNINYWFKFKPWWASTLGLSPYSSVSYEVTTTKTIADNTEGDYQYSGSGNISQLYWGNSFKLFNNFTGGFHMAYLFGSINRSEAIADTPDSEALILNDKVFTNKLKLDYGLQYKIVLPKQRSLTIGATFDSRLKLSGKTDLTLYTSSGDTLSTQEGRSIRYDLPMSLGTGISFKTKNSLIAADAVFKQWSEANFSNVTVAFQDTWRMSLGYAYLGNENADSYLGLLSFKAGVYLQNHYMQVKDNKLMNYGFSMALEFLF